MANGAARRRPRSPTCARGRAHVEMRGTEGRLVRRIALKTGDTVTVRGCVEAGVRAAAGRVGRAAGRLRPPRGRGARAGRVQQVQCSCRAVATPRTRSRAQQMPPEWLAFDAARRPLGGAAALNAAARRDLSTRVCAGARRAGHRRGLAAVAQLHRSRRGLIAAGAGEPDVVALTPERMDSVNRATARFDYVPPLSRRGIGLLAADVLECRRARGRAGGSRQRGSSRRASNPATVIVRADGQPVTDSAQVQQLIDAKQPGEHAGDRGARRRRHRADGAAARHREPAPDLCRPIRDCCSTRSRWRCAAVSLRAAREGSADPAAQSCGGADARLAITRARANSSRPCSCRPGRASRWGRSNTCSGSRTRARATRRRPSARFRRRPRAAGC